MLIAANSTATPVTVDNTTQSLYADFRDIPTVMISHSNLLLEIGDPSKEGYLTQILATFRFSKYTHTCTSASVSRLPCSSPWLRSHAHPRCTTWTTPSPSF